MHKNPFGKHTAVGNGRGRASQVGRLASRGDSWPAVPFRVLVHCLLAVNPLSPLGSISAHNIFRLPTYAFRTTVLSFYTMGLSRTLIPPLVKKPQPRKYDLGFL